MFTKAQHCYSCGRKVENDFCLTCNKSACADGLKQVLDENNSKGAWPERKWMKESIRLGHKKQVYACHNCKYFNYHRLNYCPKCGGKLIYINSTYPELAKLYGDYKTGY